MPIISADLHFSKADGANIAIAGVFATILARFAIGPMCDKYGPRITYTLLLAFGSIPVFGIAFAWDYTSFLVFRLLIGIIGASLRHHPVPHLGDVCAQRRRYGQCHRRRLG